MGGVQVSLLNLIQQIHSLYSVTVLSFENKEEYRALLPSDVELIGVKSPFRFLGVSQGELRNKPIEFLMRGGWAVMIQILGRPRAIKLMELFQPTFGEYDCAISYLHEGPVNRVYGGCNDFVLDKVQAQWKVAWLHCDFGRSGADNAHSQKIYRQFDAVVACSEGCGRSFLKCLPDMEQKTFTIRNCHDYDRIRELAKDGVSYASQFFNVVTVARLAEEKGIDRAIHAVKSCVQRGYPVHYHIIGAGDQEIALKQLTEELGLTGVVSFYGNQTNPYRYIKNADLFLLPSHNEAAPMVFDEAACLGVPVLATETTSTDEMILKSCSGIVCENSQEGVTSALLKIVENPGILYNIREALKKRDFTNAESICALHSVLGNRCN